MLDDRGFVATCNSTHFFIIRKGELWTSAGGFALGGITRDAVYAPRDGRESPPTSGTFRSTTSTPPTRRSAPARSPGSVP